MLKQMKETNNKINANGVGAGLVSAQKEKTINKSIANAVGGAPQGDPQTKNIMDKPIANVVGADSISAHKKITKNTLKEHSNLTSQKGITLIALVITIIIMLILVTVTITVALKGELFNTAKQAKTETENKINEEQNLASGKVEIDGEWYNSIEEYTDGGKGTIPTEDNYGDFVEYGVDLNGNNKTDDDWKVFYVDDKGRTFIIAADYVSSNKCEALKTATSASKMTENTSDTYKGHCYYWDYNDGNLEVTYDCYDKHNETMQNDHTQNKQQCSYPDIFMGTGYYCSDHVGDDGKGGYENSRCASSLMCTDNWSGFVDTNYGATYAIGGPTLEMWVASWNKKHGQDVDKGNGITLYANGNENSKDKTGYYVGTTESTTDEYYSITSCTDGYNDTLYFPHQNSSNLSLDGDNNQNDYCDGYWLASPSANYNSYLMSVYCNGSGRVSYGEYFDHYCLRCSSRSLSNIWSQIGKNWGSLELSRF